MEPENMTEVSGMNRAMPLHSASDRSWKTEAQSVARSIHGLSFYLGTACWLILKGNQTKQAFWGSLKIDTPHIP